MTGLRNSMSHHPPEVISGIEVTGSDGEVSQLLITRLCSITVSPVMEVEVVSGPRKQQKAILKLFDRRCGVFRKTYPYTSDSNDSWESCVRLGRADEIIRKIQVARSKYIKARFGKKDDQDEDDEDDKDDDEDFDQEEQEVLAYDNAQSSFEEEIRAYKKLKSMQGCCIPTFFDSVSWHLPNRPSDLPDKYFIIPGILIEYIPGFTLAELTEKYPHQPDVWKYIVCDAVEVARAVNNMGVINIDYQPRNILVLDAGGGMYRTFHIDFSMCLFEEDWTDSPNILDENSWIFKLRSNNNPRAVATIMSMRIERLTSEKIPFEEFETMRKRVKSLFSPMPTQEELEKLGISFEEPESELNRPCVKAYPNDEEKPGDKEESP